MAIAHQSTPPITTKLAAGRSPGPIVGYALLAATAIVALYLAFYGQGLAELDPSQIIGP